MAKECLNNIRQESNELCQQEILNYMELLSKQLGDFKETAEKEIELAKKNSKFQLDMQEQKDLVEESKGK